MNDAAEDIVAIEKSMEELKEIIADGEALKRLILNKDFDRLITVGYFEKEASNLVLTKAEPSTQDAETQVSILKQLDSIGSLRNYLRFILQKADSAINALQDSEVAIEELEKEEEESFEEV